MNIHFKIFLLICSLKLAAAFGTFSFSEIAEKLRVDIPREIKKLANMKIDDFCRYFGYPFERHFTTTEDGYILQLHRIPHGKNNNTKGKTKKPVVYLQHGLLSSSMDWILMTPKSSLAFLLADAGYDVWLGNYRGNDFSQNHTTFAKDSDEFWNFSWHEMGVYDLPAMIDYSLAKTGQKNLVYIGHSQGTTGFFVMCSSKPEYNAKIKIMFALAPVSFMRNAFSPVFRFIAKIAMASHSLTKMFGTHEFHPKRGMLKKLGTKLCSGPLGMLLCANTLFLVGGFNAKNINPKLIPLMLAHSPSASCVRQMFHYAQLHNSARFCQYDYGPISNFRKYGKIFPPSYPLQKITAPVVLMYSLNDWLTSVFDIGKLALRLPNLKKKILLKDIGFTHIDFLFGKNAKDEVYKQIMDTLEHT